MKKLNISLRNEMTLILAFQFVCLVISVIIIINFIMMGSIRELEKSYVDEQSQLALNALDNEFMRLQKFVYDWAAWDDTYYFMDSLDGEYINSNLTYESIYNLELNNITFINTDGNVSYSAMIEGEDIYYSKKSIFKKKQVEDLIILNKKNVSSNKFTSGSIMTSYGPMIFAMHPIIRSDETGDPKGYLIMSEKLDDKFISKIADEYMLDVKMTSYDPTQDYINESDLICYDSILIVSNENLVSEIVLKDVFLKPISKLQINMKRDIYLVGNIGVNTLLFWTVVIVIGIGMIIYRFWDRLLLKRILLLSKDVHEAAEGGSLLLKEGIDSRSDEISLLRKEIVGMLELIEAQGESILEKQRVLENINNILEEKVKERSAEILEKNKLLQKSEIRYRTIVSLFPDAIFKVSMNGIFLECEGGNHDNLITHPQNFVGRNLDEVFPSYFLETTKEKLNLVITTKRTESFKYQVEFEGEVLDYEARMVYLSDYEIYLILRNITDSQKVVREIEYLSYHDQLTGLYNRRFFEEEFVRLSSSRNLPLAILLLDVNGLKLVNDVFGHQAGDRLLREVSEAMKMCVRSDDILARMGGDEFSIILPKTSEADAIALSERIKNKVSEIEIEGAVGSISIGCAVMINEHLKLDYLFKKADDMMYKHKAHESQLMREKTLNSLFLKLMNENKLEKLHIEFIQELSIKIGKYLKLNEFELKQLSTAAKFHDVGKVVIEDNILNKPDTLTEDEYKEVRRHAEIGYQIIKSINNMGDILDVILHHHEAWDGSGYPKGLKKEEIPLLSRIICVVDAYEAMIHDRPYRKTKTHEEAVEELLEFSGMQFDPEIVKALIEVTKGTVN